MPFETQIPGSQIKDKSVKANDTDFTTAGVKTTLAKDDYVIIINVESATDDTEIIRVGEFANEIARLNSLTKYQVDGIVSTTKGIIPLVDFVGTVIGSYACELCVDFSDLSNSTYRLTASRKLKFSLTVYQNGATIYHNLPDLIVTEHSGNIVKLSDQTITQLNYEDIYFECTLVNNALQISIVNGIGSSEIPAANGTIKAIYTLEITKFNYI